MRDVTVRLTRIGRIRYAITRAFVSLCVIGLLAVLVLVLVEDGYKAIRGLHFPGIDVFWEALGLPFCTLFLRSIGSGWLWRYPVFRAARLQICMGSVSLIGANGVVLGGIKRATADRTRDGLIWFRNNTRTSDAFDFPLYLVDTDQRRDLVAAVGLSGFHRA